MSRKGHDFTGLKLGHLTVIEPTDRRAGCNRAIWRCDCDCGNTIYLDSQALKRTKRRDCGCNILNSPFVKDLTGQRFGKLPGIIQEQRRRHKSPEKSRGRTVRPGDQGILQRAGTRQMSCITTKVVQLILFIKICQQNYDAP